MDPNALRTGLWCFGVGAKSSGHLEVFGKTLLFWGKIDGVTVLWQFDKKSQKIDFLRHRKFRDQIICAFTGDSCGMGFPENGPLLDKN